MYDKIYEQTMKEWIEYDIMKKLKAREAATADQDHGIKKQ
jgi:hypothetical protein